MGRFGLNDRTHPHPGRAARRRLRSLAGQGRRRRDLHGLGDGLPRGPRHGQRRRRPARRQGPEGPLHPDDPGRSRHRPLVGPGHAHQRGSLDLRGRGVERPGRHLAPRREHQDRGRGRRRADARGGRPGVRAGRRVAPGVRSASAARRRDRAARHLPAGAGPPRGGRRARRAGHPAPAAAARATSPRATGCRSGSTASGRCSAAGTSSSRARRAPRRTRTACCAPAPSGPPRSGCPAVAAMGFDIVYLPPIHPIGTTNRKGPNNTLSPGPDDVGSPWAIGSADGGHDAIHPDLGTDGGLRRVRDEDDRPRHGGRARPRAAGHPGPPVGDRAPRVVHRARRRHDRVRREPAEEVPGHLPGQLRPRPRGHLRRGAADRPEVDRPRRADLPGRQPAHQAGRVLGVAAGGGAQDRPGRAVPRRGVHPAGDDADAGPGRLPPVATRTSPGATRSGSSRSTSPSCRRRPRTSCGPTSSSTPPTSCTPTCSTAGRRRSRSGPCWPRRCRRPGASTPASSCSSTSPCGRAARSTSTPRSTSSGRATGPPPRREGRSLAPYLTRLNEIRRAHPALQRLRNLRFHPTDSDQIICYSKGAFGAATRRSDDVDRLVVVNLDPHGARETTVRLDLPALGMEWDDTHRRARRDQRRQLHLGPGELRAPRPVPRAGPRLPGGAPGARAEIGAGQ